MRFLGNLSNNDELYGTKRKTKIENQEYFIKQ